MKRLSEKEISTLILLGTFIFGAWLRLVPASLAGFPLNDGGMFYSMINDLRQNSYALPAFTTYNNLNIPYTYPPLAFYMAGWLADLFHFSDLTVLLWLPAVINILTLPAFALLAKSMLKSSLKAALATLFYTLTPLSMDWFLMGGGLTRGLGQLFLILTAWCAYELFNNRSRKYLLGAIAFGSLVALCHPESALLALTSAGIIWLFSSPTKRTFFDAILVCAGVTVICSPWLFYVLRLHGFSPFFNAMQTNGNTLFLWTALFSFDFAQETGLALMTALGLIALFKKLGQKEILFPAWLAIPFFINPRSSARSAILPLAMLAAICLLEVVLPAIQGNPAHKSRSRNISAGLFLVYLLSTLLINAYALGLKMDNNRLSEADRQAMAWVSQNTPPDSMFIILTGESQMMRDPVQEWFPALSERRSQTTLQGLEWLWGVKFIESIGNYQGLKNCILQDLACINEQTRSLGISFDHVYIKKQPAGLCNPDETCRYGKTLINELRNSGEYKISFEDNETAIFEKCMWEGSFLAPRIPNMMPTISIRLQKGSFID